MMVWMALDYHETAINLLGKQYTGMIVRECQRRKRQKQIGTLLERFVDAISRAYQENPRAGLTDFEPTRQLDRVEEFAFFGQDNTDRSTSGKTLFK